MTTFKEARAFLLQHRTDYATAVADFRWPDPVPFNWALDWFDAGLARDPESKSRTALWIVDAGSNRETKLSFEALSRQPNQVANFLRPQGLKRGDHLLLLLGNVVPLWETMLAAIRLGAVVIPATTQLTSGDVDDRITRGGVRHMITDAQGAGRLTSPERLGVRLAVGGAPGFAAFDEARAAPAEIVNAATR